MQRRKSKNNIAEPAVATERQDPVEDTAKIWTRLHLPFRMGGDVNEPVCTNVPVSERKNLGGFEFFSFLTPKGSTFVCEAQTGGIVAGSFDELKENMQGCTQELLQEQINSSRHLGEQAREMSSEEFFSYFRY